MLSFFLGMDPALIHLDLNPRYKSIYSIILSAGKMPNELILIILRADENAFKVMPKLLVIPHFHWAELTIFSLHLLKIEQFPYDTPQTRACFLLHHLLVILRLPPGN